MAEAELSRTQRAIAEIQAHPRHIDVTIRPDIMRRTVFTQVRVTLPNLGAVLVKVQTSLSWQVGFGRGQPGMEPRVTAVEATIWNEEGRRWDQIGRLPDLCVTVE